MTGIASLIESSRSRLADITGWTEFAIVEVDGGHCRIACDGLTIHFYSRPEEGVIHSSLELRSIPTHRVPFTRHLHSWLVLRSRGEEWPELDRDETASSQLESELGRVARAIAIVGDETSLRECLLWEAGYIDGYSSWA